MIIIGILALIVGVAMGYWLADIIRIRDLREQNAQLKARCEHLEDVIDYYENKDEQDMKKFYSLLRFVSRDILEACENNYIRGNNVVADSLIKYFGMEKMKELKEIIKKEKLEK